MSSSLPARTSPLSRTPHRRYPLDQINHGSDLLVALASLRFATGPQLQRLLFDREAQTPRQARYRSTKALRQLFDTGYLTRIPVFAPSLTSGRMSRQLVHALSPAGARAVGVDPRWAQNRRPKRDEVLTHDFWLVELAVLAMEGCPEPLGIATWWDDRVLAGRKRQGLLHLPTIPDGLLVIENLSTGKYFPCLVELDLGTESVVSRGRTQRDVAHKIESYLDYLTHDFRSDFGIDAPPVVLIVASSERRLASLRAVTRQLGGGGRFWFATLGRLRGFEGVDGEQTVPSAARQGAFWTSQWQPAHEDRLRSLAARCEGSKP